MVAFHRNYMSWIQATIDVVCLHPTYPLLIARSSPARL